MSTHQVDAVRSADAHHRIESIARIQFKHSRSIDDRPRPLAGHIATMRLAARGEAANGEDSVEKDNIRILLSVLHGYYSLSRKQCPATAGWLRRGRRRCSSPLK
jgi:hypothetical protein